MLQALALRLRSALSEITERAFTPVRQRYTPAFALAGFNHALPNCEQKDDVEDHETEQDVLDDFSILNMAVPKRRVSHRRKRIKFAQKHLEPLESFVACKSCGQKHPQYYQLCPFCQPFNNFIKTKDVPVREFDRVRVKVMDRVLEERQKNKAKAAELRTKDQTTAPESSNSSNEDSKKAIKPQ